MATVSELNTTPTSGLNHIDALLDEGPDWNYLTPAGNTIYYTFSVASGNEQGRTGQEAFTLAQQGATRGAFDYISRLTGIQFVETVNGADAQIHLCSVDIESSSTVGLCSWKAGYRYNPSTNEIISYDADAYVYLDKVEWRAQNANLAPGSQGYETLLHELGHALGLKHPFEDDIRLPDSQDNTGNTLMSYDSAGGAHAQYSQYDIAALNWIYGGDGLGGALGINSASGARYLAGTAGADALTGTSHNDTLQGNGGNDMINGGEGIDTVVFGGLRSAYTFRTQADGTMVASGTDGTDTLAGVEIFQFADMTVERAAVNGVVAAPTVAVAQNGNHYAFGNKPLVSGSAEADSTVRVYLGTTVIATTTADANGLWQVVANALPDGENYRVHATATDAAGVVSAPSAFATFSVDSRAPSVPTGSVVLGAGNNQPVFSGTGEAGTVIQLFRTSDFTEIGQATVGANGRWTLNSTPLPNGDYEVGIASVDKAGNATSGSGRFAMTINSSAGVNGSGGNEVFAMQPGNSAIDGKGGLDVAVYTGARADYAISKGVWGSVVRSASGEVDALFDVERIQFSDGWSALDVDGVAGQIYRLYKATFDRPAEEGGLGYWMWRMEHGASLLQIADEFTTHPEFDTKFGVDPTDEVFITNLYRNVLDRAPDSGGFAFWLNSIKIASRAEVLVEFSESVENKGAVIELVGQGMDYTPWSPPGG